MFERQVNLARKVAGHVNRDPRLELLGQDESVCQSNHVADGEGKEFEHVYMIVLFRAKDGSRNDILAQAINAQRKIFVTGTVWKGEKACRIAVSTWKVDVTRDLQIIIESLDRALGIEM